MHKQLLLPGTPPISPDYIVNVASVAHRSPFRYPGGKTWLVPHIRQWLATYAAAPTEFIEPFAGGGIIGLSVAFEKLCNHVVFAEMDDEVASVWETILGDNGEWLADQIIEFDLEREAVEQFLKREDTDLRERALQTIIKNRVNRGGILAPGAGMIKNGENGKGIASRWYPKTLYKRIHNIIKIKDRITFIHGDAFELLSKKTEQKNTVFFIDPPYTAAGKNAGRRLYTHWELDHEKLFELTKNLSGEFLMTYENSKEVEELARKFDFDFQPVAMKNAHHQKMTELLIGRNLDWIR